MASISQNLLRFVITAGPLAGLLIVETYFPLRKVTQPRAKRMVTNLLLALVAIVPMRLAFLPLVLEVSGWATRDGFGLLSRLENPVVHGVLAFLCLDATLYWWHRGSHRIAFLWRFHSVHHSDLDMDVTTASRFHVGELILSSGYRAVQVLAFGITPAELIFFETAVTLFALFHHSNLRLPERLDAWMSYLFVSPRMHGIHHSIVRQETDANYTAILTLWDRLNRSFVSGVSQSAIVIGVPYVRELKDTGVIRSLALPFRRPKAWKLPDGSAPLRRR